MKEQKRKKRKGGSYKNAFSVDFHVNLVVRRSSSSSSSSPQRNSEVL